VSGPTQGTVEALRRAWEAADRDEVNRPAAAGRRGGDAMATAALRPSTARRDELAPDPERIWRAVAGELPPDEVRSLAAAAAADPDLAQAWRLAHELQAAMPRPVTRGARLLRFPTLAPALRWAVAATVVVAFGAGLWHQLGPSRGEPQPVLRGEPGGSITSALPDGAALPRHDFVLRWTPLPDPETRYTVRVTTADLELVTVASDLARPEFRVPAADLAAIAAGATLLWQVDGRLPDGRVVSSATATARLGN
jgi:hypothetical protein